MEIAHNTTILTRSKVFKMQQLTLLRSAWIVAIFAVAIVLMAFRVVDGEFVFKSIFFAVVGACVIPAYFIIAEIVLYKRAQKLHKVVTYKFVFTDKCLNITEIVENKTDSLSVDYSRLTDYKFGKEYIFIVAYKDSLIVISKSGFESDEEEKQVENLLKLKVQKGKKKAKN